MSRPESEIKNYTQEQKIKALEVAAKKAADPKSFATTFNALDDAGKKEFYDKAYSTFEELKPAKTEEPKNKVGGFAVGLAESFNPVSAIRPIETFFRKGAEIEYDKVPAPNTRMGYKLVPKNLEQAEQIAEEKTVFPPLTLQSGLSKLGEPGKKFVENLDPKAEMAGTAVGVIGSLGSSGVKLLGKSEKFGDFMSKVMNTTKGKAIRASEKAVKAQDDLTRTAYEILGESDPSKVQDIQQNVGRIEELYTRGKAGDRSGLDVVKKVRTELKDIQNKLGENVGKYRDMVDADTTTQIDISEVGKKFDDMAQKRGKLSTGENMLTGKAGKDVEDIKALLNPGQSESGIKVYHGTGQDFQKFDDSMRGSVTGAQSGKEAIWFTDDPIVAKAYSVHAAETGPVKKLLDQADEAEKIAKRSGLESDWKRYDDLLAEAEKLDTYDANFNRRAGAVVKEAKVDGNFMVVDAKGKTPQELSKDGDIDSWLNFQIQKAKKQKKDGVVFKNLDDGVGLYDKPATHYAVFDSNKISLESGKTRNPSDILKIIDDLDVRLNPNRLAKDNLSNDAIALMRETRNNLKKELYKQPQFAGYDEVDAPYSVYKDAVEDIERKINSYGGESYIKNLTGSNKTEARDDLEKALSLVAGRNIFPEVMSEVKSINIAGEMLGKADPKLDEANRTFQKYSDIYRSKVKTRSAIAGGIVGALSGGTIPGYGAVGATAAAPFVGAQTAKFVAPMFEGAAIR